MASLEDCRLSLYGISFFLREELHLLDILPATPCTKLYYLLLKIKQNGT